MQAQRQRRVRHDRAPRRPLTMRNRTLVGNYDRFYQNFVPGAVTADKCAGRADRLQQRHRSHERLQPDRRDIDACSTGRIRHTLLAGAEFGRQLTDNFRNTGFFNNTATSILVPFAEPDDLDAGHVPAERDRRRQPSDDQRGGGVRAGPDRAVPARAGGRRPAVRPLRPDVSQQPQRRHAGPARQSRVAPRRRRLKPIAPVSIYRATACRISRARAISSRR